MPRRFRISPLAETEPVNDVFVSAPDDYSLTPGPVTILRNVVRYNFGLIFKSREDSPFKRKWNAILLEVKLEVKDRKIIDRWVRSESFRPTRNFKKKR